MMRIVIRNSQGETIKVISDTDFCEETFIQGQSEAEKVRAVPCIKHNREGDIILQCKTEGLSPLSLMLTSLNENETIAWIKRLTNELYDVFLGVNAVQPAPLSDFNAIFCDGNQSLRYVYTGVKMADGLQAGQHVVEQLTKYGRKVLTHQTAGGLLAALDDPFVSLNSLRTFFAASAPELIATSRMGDNSSPIFAGGDIHGGDYRIDAVPFSMPKTFSAKNMTGNMDQAAAPPPVRQGIPPDRGYYPDALTSESDSALPSSLPPVKTPQQLVAPFTVQEEIPVKKEVKAQAAPLIRGPLGRQSSKNEMPKDKGQETSVDPGQKRSLTYAETYLAAASGILFAGIIGMILFALLGFLGFFFYILLLSLWIAWAFSRGKFSRLTFRKNPKASSQPASAPAIDPVFNVRIKLCSKNLNRSIDITIRQQNQFVGSDARDCLVALPFKGISRRHFSIISKTNAGHTEFCIKDENSKFGTRLNGQILQPGRLYPLRIGDSITLSDKYVFTVCSDAY